MRRPTSRRCFLVRAAAISAAAPSLSRVLGANDRIQMGLIGAGRRGFSLMNRMRTQKKHDLVFTALCDIYPGNLERAGKATGNSAEKYVDHRALLAQKDVDAVLVASPDHLHRDHLIDALAGGKDVYCEAPLCNTIRQAQDIAATAKKSKQIVQVGLQERSGPHFLSAKAEIIEAKLLGTITQVNCWWRTRWSQAPIESKLEGLDWDRFFGPAPKRSPENRLYLNWRYFWDYSGGLMSDRGHHLCDWAHWFCGVSRPAAAVMCGGAYVHVRSGWEVPDTFTATWEYEEPVKLAVDCSVSSSSSFVDWHDHGACVRGTEGTLEISRHGWRYYAESARQVLKESGASDIDGAHVENFLDCLRSRKEPNAPVGVAAPTTCATIAANTAYRRRARVAIGKDWSLRVGPSAENR